MKAGAAQIQNQILGILVIVIETALMWPFDPNACPQGTAIGATHSTCRPETAATFSLTAHKAGKENNVFL